MSRRLLRCLVVPLLVLLALPTAVAQARPSNSPLNIPVSLIAQDQFVPGVEDAIFQLSLLVGDQEASVSIRRVTASVTSYRPVRDRQDVQSVIAGELTSVIDSVELPLGEVASSEPQVAELSVPIEIGRRTRDRLQMSATGLYPIGVVLSIDDVAIASIVTFVDRLPSGTSQPDPGPALTTAIVGSVNGGPTLQADSTTAVSDDDRRVVADMLASLDATSGTPVSVALRPELVEGLARSSSEDADLYAQLQLPDSLDLLSTTFVNLDPTNSITSGYGEVFTNQLRLGEDVLAEALPQITPARTTWLQDRPLSAVGAQFVRDLGFRSITLLPSLIDSGSVGELGLVDSTRLVDLDLPNGGRIEGLVADPLIADILSAATPGQEFIAAQFVLADITMLRRDIVDRGEDMTGRALIVSTRNGRLPDADLTVALVDTLGASGQVSFVSVDEALATSRTALVDGRPVTIALPATTDATTNNLSDLMNRATTRITGFGSMVPDGDERPAMWRRVLDVLPDEGLTDEEREAYFQVVVDETQRLAESVAAPIPTTFTLGGRDSSIRLSLRNDSDTELRVRVRLGSSKLRFPQGEQVVSIPAGTVASVEVPVRVRSNGRFPVTLQLLTPEGDISLAPTTVFTARVNALAGLGQLVTGVALLLLATWWVAHFRRQHRARQEAVADTSSRHPSGEPTPRSPT